MKKDINELLRTARKDKMAIVAMDTMNELLEMVDQDDAVQGSKDVVDILAVWSQVLGGTLATIPDTKIKSWQVFMKHVETHLKLAFEERWRVIHGEK